MPYLCTSKVFCTTLLPSSSPVKSGAPQGQKLDSPVWVICTAGWENSICVGHIHKLPRRWILAGDRCNGYESLSRIHMFFNFLSSYPCPWNLISPESISIYFTHILPASDSLASSLAQIFPFELEIVSFITIMLFWNIRPHLLLWIWCYLVTKRLIRNYLMFQLSGCFFQMTDAEWLACRLNNNNKQISRSYLYVSVPYMISLHPYNSPE